MIKMLMLVVIALMILGPEGSHASSDKIERIRIAMETHCGYKLGAERARKLLKPLYLTCVPGTLIRVHKDCQLSCKKQFYIHMKALK